MIQVINKAMNILELLASNATKEFGLSEIADSLGMNHGTCANILKTLVVRNYVEQANVKKGYKLGYMIYKLGNSNMIHNEELTNIAKKDMDELGKRLNEAVIISAIKNDRRIVLYTTSPNQELQVRTTLEASVYRASTGRMIIAHYPLEKLQALVERIGLPNESQWPEVKSFESLEKELEQIRRKNIVVYTNRNHVVGLATPIYRNDKVFASLGIYLPDTRFGKQKQIIAALQETTDRINDKIREMDRFK